MAESAHPHTPLALLANDAEWSGRSIETLLVPRGYAVMRAYTASQALARARSALPDVIILDADLPGASGIEVCRKLRADHRIGPTTPIIVTTAEFRTREKRLEALRAGAWDYLGMPFDAEELVVRLDTFVRAKIEADMRKENSLIDSDTGLYNRRGLLQRAREIGSDSYRHGRAVACVAIALSRDAQVGPDEAERLAATGTFRLARFLKTSGRISDAIGHVDKDEFVVIAPATNETGAFQLARRVVDSLTSGERKSGQESLNLRVGYCAVDNFRRAGVEVTTLVARANAALDLARSDTGGEVIRAFDGDVQTRINWRADRNN